MKSDTSTALGPNVHPRIRKRLRRGPATIIHIELDRASVIETKNNTKARIQELGFSNGSLRLAVNTPDDIVETSLALAHQPIHELKHRDPENSTFEQVGLLDGKEIALEYLQYGEVGIALEHLLYMIHEADIAFPRERVVQLHALATQYKLVVNHYSKENLATLQPGQRKFVYNAL